MDRAAGAADDRESTVLSGEPMKRFTIDVLVSLHRRVKAACPQRGLELPAPSPDPPSSPARSDRPLTVP
jgi:hypothetical protein